VRCDDFIISRANTKEFVGAVVHVDQDYPLRLLSDKTLRLVVDQARVRKDFLLFALRSPQARGHIEHFATGTSDSMRNISHGVISSIPLLLPSLDRQRQIAGRLNTAIAEAVKAAEAAHTQIVEIGALSAAAYREAFLDVTPVAVPPTFPVAPTGWAWNKLTSVAALESGHTPSRLQPEWWGGDISWLSLTEIRALDGTWVEQTQIRTNPAGIANSSARILPRGTVCLSRTASVGFVAIMGEPMATSQDFANWICGEDLDPEFLMFALIASRKAIRDMATGATHKTIYMPALGSFHICAPDIDEQRRIASRLKGQLAEVAALQAALSQRVKDIAALPKRILAQAFEI
jgi:type I restriction enzyme S subunit